MSINRSNSIFNKKKLKSSSCILNESGKSFRRHSSVGALVKPPVINLNVKIESPSHIMSSDWSIDKSKSLSSLAQGTSHAGGSTRTS